MEAIKKKVQNMKVEKDNLCDRMDEVEQVSWSINKIPVSVKIPVSDEIPISDKIPVSN